LALTSCVVLVQVGNFMHYISRFLAGFAIGFSQVWQISLVTLAIVPLIAIAGGIYAYVTIGLMARVRKSYVKAGEIAEEVRPSIVPLSMDFSQHEDVRTRTDDAAVGVVCR
jgi:ATP-binding cassette subfamily B (MDR/TAP) protein 1